MTARTTAIGAVITRPPFATLFEIDAEVCEAIAHDMKAHGFDPSTPIQVWHDQSGLVVVDGHTRLSAAHRVGLGEVTVYEHVFDSELAALEFAIHQQRDRRNITPLELLNAIKAVDETRRKARGGTGANRYTKSTEGSRDPSVKSREQTALIVGTSPATVQRARTIFDDPTGTALEEVKRGVSISRAATQAMKRKKPAKPTNGRLPMQRHDDEDWFRAKEAGTAVEVAMIVATRDVRAAVDKLAATGVHLREHMGDRRVSAGWNKAIKEGNALIALIRGVTRDKHLFEHE